jgi:hypothetical protein
MGLYLEITVCWDVTSCLLVIIYRLLEEFTVWSALKIKVASVFESSVANYK